MLKVTKRISKSTKCTDKIFFEVDNAKSYASLVLLNNYYLLRDETHIQSYSYLMLRIGFSRKYLTHVLETTGSLSCSYCPKTNLKIELQGMKVSNGNKATIDHIIPTSKGGDSFDYANLCVACGTCNSEKSDMSLDEYLIYKENKRQILWYKKFVVSLHQLLK